MAKCDFLLVTNALAFYTEKSCIRFGPESALEVGLELDGVPVLGSGRTEQKLGQLVPEVVPGFKVGKISRPGVDIIPVILPQLAVPVR
jgi:hypothetical protein